MSKNSFVVLVVVLDIPFYKYPDLFFFSEIRQFSNLLGNIIDIFECFSVPALSMFPLGSYFLLFVLVSVFISSEYW